MSSDTPIIVLTFRGSVSADELRRELEETATRLLPDARVGVVFDASAVTDYSPDARSMFVEWNAAHRSSITRVAVVTRELDWVTLVQAAGLESAQTIKAFTDRTAAEAWVR